MAEGVRARWFGWMADLGLRRPVALLLVVAAIIVGTGVLIPGLGVSTSRTGLVSDEDPQQALLLDFYERFGRPESAVFVVHGGDAPARREVVDRLQVALEAEPALHGRVLGRVQLDTLAPLLLLQRPQLLAELQARLPPKTDLPALIEGGLPAWLGALEERIYGQLEGADAPAPGGDAASIAEATAQADAGLRGLATAARLLDAVLAGEDPMSLLPTEEAFAAQPGLDEAGYPVTADGENHLLTVFAELPSDEGADVAPLVERMRALRDTVMADAPEGLSAELTGMPGLITDELGVLQRGMKTSTVATTLGIALLCMLLFRSVRQMLIALVPLLPGVMATLAVVRVLYDDLNLVTSSFVAVLLGLGIDFSVHVIARFNEELRAGRSREEALRAAMVHGGPGVLTGAIVTAAAFLVSATTEFTAFRELGIVTSIGLMVVVLCTFLILPATLRGRKGPEKAPPELVGLSLLPRVVRRLRWPLLAVGLAVAVVGGVLLPGVDFNPRYFDFLPERTEASHALNRLEYDPLASPVFANLRADSIEQAREMTTQLRGLDSVAGVQTPTDLLPPLSDEKIAALRTGLGAMRTPDFDRLAARSTDAKQLASAVGGVIDALDESRLAMSGAGMSTAAMDEALAAFKQLRDRARALDDAGQARLAGIEAQAAAVLGPAWKTAAAVAERGGYAPEDLPPLFRRRYVSEDGTQVALYAVPAGEFWERDVAERFRLDVVAVDPKVSGLATVHVRHGEIVVEGFQRAAIMAAGLVLLILAVDLRSIKDALLALVPTALGWLWMIAAMIPLGLRFDVANVVSMPLVLGIGIAFGVHMMHRCREVEAQDVPMPERLDRVVRGTGGAIAIAALTTMLGFVGLTFSEHGGMTSVAYLMILGIGACLVATVLMLPALLLAVRRVR